jgi:hypothetical protein
MHPQPRLAFHCASARLIQSGPVIEQAKKDALAIGDGSPTDPKCFAHAGISRFVLLSVARGRERGDAGRDQESASFHCCFKRRARAGVPEGKFSATDQSSLLYT